MIGFRVDANEKIATGHLMRCIAIAEACRKRGEECIFFLAEGKETNRLRERNFTYEVLDTKWDDMESERDVMKRRVEALDWLVVDSYQATEKYLSFLQRYVPILYIDDFRKQVYKVSAVLAYIPGGNEDELRKQYAESETELLQGFMFAPLREEFARQPETENREKSILITTGGTDTYNIAGRVLECCREMEVFAEYRFHVIVGSMNQHEKDLEELAYGMKNIVLHKNISDICDYMLRCEIALSASGTTLLELCACRIPTVCFSFADNQKPFAREMERRNVVRYVGDAREQERIEYEICRQLLLFRKDGACRRAYAKRMGEIVDGMGADRIAEFLSRKEREL